MEAETQVFAQRQFTPGARVGVPKRLYDAVHCAALCHAAADYPLYPVLRHKVQPARRGALNRLPALHRQPQRARHHRYALQFVAAIRHIRRNRVVLALVRKRLFVERLEDYVHLLLEHIAVAALIEQRRSESLDLAAVIPAPHAEYHPPARQNIRRGIVLGEPQRMPHRRYIEAAADVQPLRCARQMNRRHQHIRDALIPFRLKVMLRQPKGVIPVGVHRLRDSVRLGIHRRQMFVPECPIVHRRPAVPHILHIHMPRVQAIELGNHHCLPYCLRIALIAIALVDRLPLLRFRRLTAVLVDFGACPLALAAFGA